MLLINKGITNALFDQEGVRLRGETFKKKKVGISATSTKKRDGFNEMIVDALNGKIDMIVTKSVLRFAEMRLF